MRTEADAADRRAAGVVNGLDLLGNDVKLFAQLSERELGTRLASGAGAVAITRHATGNQITDGGIDGLIPCHQLAACCQLCLCKCSHAHNQKASSEKTTNEIFEKSSNV